MYFDVLSDLHLADDARSRYILDFLIERTKHSPSKYLLILGDTQDQAIELPDDIKKKLALLAKNYKEAFCVDGNHGGLIYEGKKKIVVDNVESKNLAELGFTPMGGKTKTLENGLNIMGVEYPVEEFYEPDQALDEISQIRLKQLAFSKTWQETKFQDATYTLAMVHSPDKLDEVDAKNTCFATGHYHGAIGHIGNVGLYTPDGFFKIARGLEELEENVQIFHHEGFEPFSPAVVASHPMLGIFMELANKITKNDPLQRLYYDEKTNHVSRVILKG